MAVSLQWSVSVSYPSNTEAKVSVTLKAKSTSGSYNKTSSSYGYIKIDGTKYGNFSHTFSANTTTTLGTKSKTITRGTSAKSVSLYAWWHTDVSSGNISKSGSTTVSARPAYTVTFNGNGGTSSSATVYYGYTTTFPSTSRTGYTFNKWNGAYAAGAATPAITAATTYTAYWIENTATLTYNANGYGTAPASVTMRYTAAQATAAAITGVTGYHFTGWNTKADGSGTSYAAGAQVKAANVNPSAMTLYAQWAINVYTINFDANGDNAVVSPTTMTKTHGQVINLPTPTWSGHIFVGWNSTSEGSEGIDFGAETYNGNGSSHEDIITLYARWSNAARPIYVHYYNSATNIDSISIIYKIFNEDKTVIAEPSVANYVFKGWYRDTARTQEWTGFDYESDLLVISPDTSVITGKTYYTPDTTNKRWVEVNAPTGNPNTSGYFELNYDNAANNPLHVYAKWNEQYTIIFNINSPSYNDGITAEGSVSSITCENEQQITLPSSSASYVYGTGQCTADGWGTFGGDANIKEYGNNTYLTLSGYTAGYVFNLYAVWTPTNYKVILKKGTATSGADIEISQPYYTTYTLPSTIPEDWNWIPAANHHLSNWLLGATNVPLATTITVLNNITYTAAWVDSYHVPVIPAQTGITTKRYIDANYLTTSEGGKYIQITAVGTHGSYDGVTTTTHTYSVDVKFYDTNEIVGETPVAHYVLSLTNSDETFSQTWGKALNPSDPYARPIFDKKLNMLYCVLEIIDTTNYGNDITIDLEKRKFTYEFEVKLKRAIGLHMADDLSAITMFDELVDGDEGLIITKQFSMNRLWTWTVDPQTQHLYLNWMGGTNE